jgi:hypothetical protein
MAHDYAITVGGVNLKTTIGVREAIFVKYATAQKKDGNLILPYKHGELFVPDKFYDGTDVLLQVYLPFEDVGDAAQALSDLALLLATQSEVVVAQVDPAKGNIRARVENLQDPVPTEDRFTYLFSLRNASGFWEDVTATTAASANPPVVLTLGDRPIDDMILTFSGPGFLQHTDSLGQISRIEIDAAAGAGTYVVDVGKATILKGAVAQDEFLVVDQPWWMKWQPTTAENLTSNVSVAASWRNKWA